MDEMHAMKNTMIMAEMKKAYFFTFAAVCYGFNKYFCCKFFLCITLGALVHLRSLGLQIPVVPASTGLLNKWHINVNFGCICHKLP